VPVPPLWLPAQGVKTRARPRAAFELVIRLRCVRRARAQVDVEGWEWAVLAGAHGMLISNNVENVVMEYSPGAYGFGHGYDAVTSVKLWL
jgi:hypothetical protein